MLKLLLIILLNTNIVAVKKITKTVIKKDVPKSPKAVAKPDPVKIVPKSSKVGDNLKNGDVRKVGNKTTTYSTADTTGKKGWGGNAFQSKNFVDGVTKVDSAKSVSKKTTNGDSSKLYALNTNDNANITAAEIKSSRKPSVASQKAKLEDTRIKKK